MTFRRLRWKDGIRLNRGGPGNDCSANMAAYLSYNGYLLEVSFTQVCLQLAFFFCKGQHYIVFGPCQQVKANCQQTQLKLAAKQTVYSVFGVPLLTYRTPGLPEQLGLI